VNRLLNGFRFEQYFVYLKQAGIDYQVSSFIDRDTWSILYNEGHYRAKAFGIIKGFFRRIFSLIQILSTDFVFIHREATPVGPPVFEFIISKILRKKIIYDFDDAIWLPNTSDSNKLVAGIKWHNKVASICKWSYKISCGNEYLSSYSKQFNSNVTLNPTTIDTENLHNKIKNQQTEKTTIGWTGTHSTLHYLKPILPVIKQLETEIDFDFIIISSRQPEFQLKSLKYIPWNKSTEIDDLLEINIGIMPLTDDKWAHGKCGFKALQYMALGIPAVLSPVGVNRKIVADGKDGFLCNQHSEWIDALKKLLSNKQLRIDMGKNARKKIEQKFSVNSNRENFLSLFK
jgi:glycosyltransferase involved in cell wall biosynthesis